VFSLHPPLEMCLAMGLRIGNQGCRAVAPAVADNTWIQQLG